MVARRHIRQRERAIKQGPDEETSVGDIRDRGGDIRRRHRED